MIIAKNIPRRLTESEQAHWTFEEFGDNMRIQKLLLFTVLVQVISCAPQLINSAHTPNTIVLINVSPSGNSKLIEQLKIINAADPKVIGIDVALNYVSEQDDLLVEILQKSGKVVMPSSIGQIGEDINGDPIVIVSPTSMLPLFSSSIVTGFVSSAVNNGDTLTIPPVFDSSVQDYLGNVHYHFSLCLAMAYDSALASKFAAEHQNNIKVKYRRPPTEFATFHQADLLNGKVPNSALKGKIVILGFLGPGANDKYFSDRTKVKEPDIYGVQHLANILLQILENDR